ncbi:MAG: DUF1707 domain-containing protein [Sphaerobacter sp.]|nr:DUF1707 domain-containing protein [Sphaerobacter sp.]
MQDDVLASDADRERAIATLRRATVEGRLTTDELLNRTEAALTARTRQELAALTRDVAGTSAVAAPGPAVTRVQAVLGEAKRLGPWRAEGRLDVVAVMGDCTVDLREAEIVGDELLVHVTAIMASVKIYVPEGATVVVDAQMFLSSQKDERIGGDRHALGGPTIRIQGMGLMSDLQVRDRDRPLLERLSETLSGRRERETRR